MKISCCMIVRDAIEALPIAVKSIAGVVDELVIVDTGSVDGTKELARSLADVYDELPWNDDFSEARNYALSKCSGDWIVSLDADEQLAPQSAAILRQVLEAQPEQVHLLMCYMKMFEKGELTQQFLAEKIYRGHCRYKGAMHNWVDVGEEFRAAAPMIEFHHDRGPLSDEVRSRRNTQRLRMAEKHLLPEAERNPKARRSLFYLAGTYRDAGLPEKALPWFERYLETSDWKPERFQAAVLAAQCAAHLGDLERAKKYLALADVDNWQRNEHWMLQGELAMLEGDRERARHYYRFAKDVPMPLDPFFVEVPSYTWTPYFRLAEVALNTQEWEEFHANRKEALARGMPENMLASLDQGVFTLTPPPIKRLGVLVDRGQKEFILPLLNRWRGRFEITLGNEEKDIEELSGWADTLWFEWAGPLLAAATKREKKNRIIVRVHGYEIHSGLLSQVEWGKVDGVIFTARYQRELSLRQCPDIGKCRLLVAHAGIDCDKFIVGAGKPGNKVAMACYGNYKKNFPLALQVFAKAQESRPDLELHIAVEWQDSRIKLYVDTLIRELNLEKKVFFHPWQEDLNRFYADKSFYLSTSIEESLHVACGEAMAAGLRPVVHCWESSRDFYPPECIFRTIEEGARMLTTDPTFHYRHWAQKYLDIAVLDRKVGRFLRPPRVAILARDNEPRRIEYRLTECFEENGCLPAVPENADAIVLCDPSIVANAPKLQGLGMPKVFWCSELITGDDNVAKAKREAMKPALEWADILVASHEPAAQVIREMAPGKPVHVAYLGGAHRGLRPLGLERDIDVGFVGILNDRRRKIVESIRAAGTNVVCLEDYNPENVNRFLNRCKIALNIHWTDEPNTETRVAEVQAAGAYLLTERLQSPLGGWMDYAIVDKPEEFPEACQDILRTGSWERNGREGQAAIWRDGRLEQQTEKILEILGM